MYGTRFTPRLFAYLITLSMGLLNLPSSLMAQTSMATLVGVVTDPSGAVVPNASVTLQGTMEKYSRETTSDSGGRYTIPAIPPGKYKLVAKASGFRPEEVSEFALDSGAATSVNVQLTVGALTEEITVTGAPPLLETGTATLGTVVQSEMVAELPLFDRNWSSLQLILPGVSPINDYTGATWHSPLGISVQQPSVYGQRSRDNNYTLDGVPNTSPVLQGISAFPPPEAIAEVKVESGITSGAAGWASGANVNVVTRAGTNEYHGDLWESLQNAATNARGFFPPSLKNFKLNQFGAAFGGPLQIPHLIPKEKGWYVFGYYEGIRLHKASQWSALIPTAEQQRGNFAGGPTIYDPFSTTLDADGQPCCRLPFSGNVIPASQISPDIAALIKYPAPNSSLPGTNYINLSPAKRGSDHYEVRIDHQFGAKQHVSGRWLDDYGNRFSSYMEPQNQVWSMPVRNLEGTDVITLSPTFFVTGRFGYQLTSVYIYTPGNAQYNAPLLSWYHNSAIQAVWPARSGYDAPPGINIQGNIWGPNQWAATPKGGFGPEHVYTYTGDAQKVQGPHTLQFGGGITYISAREGSPVATNNGSVTFSPLQTGDLTDPNTGIGFASFLLGVPYSATRTFNNIGTLQYAPSYSLYVQDAYRATSKLTLNLGLRWEYAQPWHVDPGCAGLDYETGVYVWDKTNPITGAPANIRRGCFAPHKANLAPRIGVAYQLNPKTVVRTGYSIFYNMHSGYAWPNSGWPYGAVSQTVTGLNPGIPSALFPDPFPPGTSPAGATDPVSGGGPCCLQTSPDTHKPPYVQQWTLSIQRQIAPSLMGEIAYFGSHSVHLDGQIADNTALYPAPGPITDRQRYPQYAVGSNELYVFPAYYEALSLKIEKRFTKGLSFLASYTWAHNIDYMDASQNIWEYGNGATRFDWQGLKGDSSQDVRQRFVGSYLYQIPGKTTSKLANAILADWQVSGVISYTTGNPLTVITPYDYQNTGSWGYEAPNVTCNPYANFTPNPPAQGFNTSCFSIPALYTVGNSGRNNLREPGWGNVDIGLSKRWPFKERASVQLRVEAFNVANTVAFLYMPAAVGTPTFGTAQDDLGTGNGQNSPRVVQFQLKVHF